MAAMARYSIPSFINYFENESIRNGWICISSNPSPLNFFLFNWNDEAPITVTNEKVTNCELELGRMMVVKENGSKLQGIGARAVILRLKQNSVQESLRSKVTSHLLSLLSKITFMYERGGVKLLIATV